MSAFAWATGGAATALVMLVATAAVTLHGQTACARSGERKMKALVGVMLATLGTFGPGKRWA